MIFNKLHRTQTVRPLSNEVPLKLEGLLEIPKRFMGTEIDQSYAALYFFEHYIDFYKFEYVVEFGSRDGGLSIFLANMASITEQFIFHTFEYNKELDWYNRIKGGVGHWFDELEKVSPYIKSFEMDVFSYQTMDIVKSNIDKYKTLIFCDNGDKPREFNLYAPLIKPGDCIVTHDWNTGIFQHQINDTIINQNLQLDEPWATNCEELKNLIRPFKKL